MLFKKFVLCSVALISAAAALRAVGPAGNVAEEVAWLIGDQPIWRSEIEENYRSMKQEKQPIKGDPYCYIPEKIALERIYLHQADLDTIEAKPSMVAAEVDGRLNEWIAQVGSRERLEEYMHKSIPELRNFLTERITNNYRMQQVQHKVVGDVKVTPAQVRRFYEKLPVDSIPYIPATVEVQIVTLTPHIPRETIDEIKDRLRGFADRVNSGSAEFSTLAIMYSQDGASNYGGEIGFMPRAGLDPAYADVAFSLTDPKKASKVVESEFGYHIIQLIEKRGDKVNTRHILLQPKADPREIEISRQRLDSIRADILDEKFSFEEAASVLSQDKDTRNNHGLMTNTKYGSDNYNTSQFRMDELPAEVARAIASLEPGQVSKAFTLKEPRKGREVVCIAKLKNRVPAHRANMTNDYQILKQKFIQAEQQRILAEWVKTKIADTYIKVNDGWADCPDWEYNWLKK